MTPKFDTFFKTIMEEMVANDVATVGTGWDDPNAGGIPKVLGPMQRRGCCKKKRKRKGKS